MSELGSEALTADKPLHEQLYEEARRIRRIAGVATSQGEAATADQLTEVSQTVYRLANEHNPTVQAGVEYDNAGAVIKPEF